MQNGWTGAQYSLLRVLLGAWVTAALLGPLVAWSLDPDGSDRVTPTVLVLVGLAIVAATAVGVGWHDRPAACVAGPIWVLAAGPHPDPASVAVGVLLLAHALTPPAPYGSVAACGRDDPGGGWQFPALLFAALWAVQALAWLRVGLAAPASEAALATHGVRVFGGLFPVLALVGRVRPWVWATSLALVLAGVPAGGAGLLLWHLATFDPGWIPPLPAGERDCVFYDGACGLCHRFVRFLLAEDVDGRAFAFAPLSSATFAAAVPTAAARALLPDSVVVVTADGRTLVRSEAALYVGEHLGGLWRALALAGRLVPRTARDALYDLVARHRRRLFAAPSATCPLVPPALRTRFLA